MVTSYQANCQKSISAFDIKGFIWLPFGRVSQNLVSIVRNRAQVVLCRDRLRLYPTAWQLWSACRAHRDRVALTHTLARPRRSFVSHWNSTARASQNKDNAASERTICMCVRLWTWGGRICHFIEVISIHKLSLPSSPLLLSDCLRPRRPVVPLSQLNLQKPARALCPYLSVATASLLLLSSSTLSSEGSRLAAIILLCLFMCGEEACVCGCHDGRSDQHTWESWQVSWCVIQLRRRERGRERGRKDNEDRLCVINTWWNVYES